MTDEIKHPKHPPDYRMFIETDDACLLQIGVAWKHKTHEGLNALLNSGDRYVFYPSRLDRKKPVLMTERIKGPGLNLVLECADGQHLYFHTLNTKRVKAAAMVVQKKNVALHTNADCHKRFLTRIRQILMRLLMKR